MGLQIYGIDSLEYTYIAIEITYNFFSLTVWCPIC